MSDQRSQKANRFEARNRPKKRKSQTENPTVQGEKELPENDPLCVVKDAVQVQDTHDTLQTDVGHTRHTQLDIRK